MNNNHLLASSNLLAIVLNSDTNSCNVQDRLKKVQDKLFKLTNTVNTQNNNKDKFAYRAVLDKLNALAEEVKFISSARNDTKFNRMIEEAKFNIARLNLDIYVMQSMLALAAGSAHECNNFSTQAVNHAVVACDLAVINNFVSDRSAVYCNLLRTFLSAHTLSNLFPQASPVHGHAIIPFLTDIVLVAENTLRNASDEDKHRLCRELNSLLPALAQYDAEHGFKTESGSLFTKNAEKIEALTLQHVTYNTREMAQKYALIKEIMRLGRYPNIYNALLVQVKNTLLSLKANLEMIKGIVTSLDYNRKNRIHEDDNTLFSLVADCFLFNLQQEAASKKLNAHEKNHRASAINILNSVNQLVTEKYKNSNVNSLAHIIPNAVIAQIHLIALQSYENNRNTHQLEQVNDLKRVCTDLLSTILQPTEKTFTLHKRALEILNMLNDAKGLKEINHIKQVRNALVQEINHGKDVTLHGIASKLFREIDFVIEQFTLADKYHAIDEASPSPASGALTELDVDTLASRTFPVTGTPLRMQVRFANDFFTKIPTQLRQEITQFLQSSPITYRNCLSLDQPGVKFVAPQRMELIFATDRKDPLIKSSVTLCHGVTTINFDYAVEGQSLLRPFV